MKTADEALFCVVVGAGVAGLTAARRLREAGKSAPVLDKGHVPGGRLTTRRLFGGVFDSGTQYITPRRWRFQQIMEEWKQAGLALEWGHGFIGTDGVRPNDRYPRMRIRNGMRTLGEHLAQGLQVRMETRVTEIWWRGEHWELVTEVGEEIATPALILTPPVPQALALIDAGNYELPRHARRALERLTYHPCIALLAKLTGPSGLPEPGGLHLNGDPVDWIADNRMKGISPGAWAVTIHAGRQFSEQSWERSDEELTTLLLDASRPHLRAEPTETQIKRWRYSEPATVHDDDCLLAVEQPPLIFAGDAFGGAKVEGAVLSGLAAAEQLLTEKRSFLRQLLPL